MRTYKDILILPKGAKIIEVVKDEIILKNRTNKDYYGKNLTNEREWVKWLQKKTEMLIF